LVVTTPVTFTLAQLPEQRGPTRQCAAVLGN
jgi:hypothetical protein